MAKFRKKSVVIEAVQWRRGRYFSEVPDWLDAAFRLPPESKGFARCVEEVVHVYTLEGCMTAEFGDWIVRGVKGELYPVKDEIFRLTYEPVPDGGSPPAPNMRGGS